MMAMTATHRHREPRQPKSGAHRAAENLVPPRAFDEVMRAHGLTVIEAAEAIGRTPARVRELTRRLGGSSKSFEHFVVCIHERDQRR